MNVKQLIEALQKMPPEARVKHLWDGAARTEIEMVWLAQSGDVVTADFCEVCRDDEDRPVEGPTVAQVEYWRTPFGGMK